MDTATESQQFKNVFLSQNFLASYKFPDVFEMLEISKIPSTFAIPSSWLFDRNWTRKKIPITIIWTTFLNGKHLTNSFEMEQRSLFIEYRNGQDETV